MSNRRHVVFVFSICCYLFATNRVSEAITIFKENLLLMNHKAFGSEIEFVSVVKLLTHFIMYFGYCCLEDVWNISKVSIQNAVILLGYSLKTVLKPHGLAELYKRLCKIEKAQALRMETGEKENEYLDEVFPSFCDDISPEEYEMSAASEQEMGITPKESLIRQQFSDTVKGGNFLREILSLLETFDKEKTSHPWRISDGLHFFYETIKHIKQELLNWPKEIGGKGRAASARKWLLYGKAWLCFGDYSKAKESFEEALAISIEKGDTEEEAACYGMLGAVCQGLRQYDEAEKNLEKQRVINKEIGDVFRQARSYENLGTVHQFLVKECFRKAHEIARKTGDRDIETSYCKKLGDLFEALGEPVRARGFQDELKALSTNIGHNIGFIGHKMISFMFCCIGNHHAGLCSAELARARTLADILSTQYSVEMKRPLDYFNPQKQIGMERILKTERNCCCLYISYFSQFISVWLLKADHSSRFQGIKVSDFFAKSLSNDADASCRKIDRNKHHLTPEKGKDQSLFPSQYFRENNLPFSRLIEEDDDEEVQRTTLAPADYYNITIAPIVDFLDEPEIIIVPDRVFFRLPFAALKDKSGKYLSEKFRIRIAPSLTTLKMIQDSPADYHSQTGALIVGDPDVGRVLYKGISLQIPRLPDASKEAKMIGRLLGVQPLLGKQATKREILQSISSVSLIHFAAHGDDKRGEIFLAPPPMLNRTPQEEDYLLTMQEILQVRVRAKLVVLSCCHSANGKIRQEGVVGIGRAFLASGARSVLVALWAIEDKATYQLMIRFYEHLVRGESASESLHQAMKWMRENGYSKVGQWAPFMLIGDNVSFDFQRIRLVKIGKIQFSLPA